MSRQDFMKGCKGQNPELLARGKTYPKILDPDRFFDALLSYGSVRENDNGKAIMLEGLTSGMLKEADSKVVNKVVSEVNRDDKNSLLLDAMKQGREL